MKTVRLNYPLSLLMPLLAIVVATPAKAQPITPANDGTGTTVTPQGNQFNIQGGTKSGANLFHSFDQFNLNSGQTANFLTAPDTRNILGRVTGGNASIINGLIQVIGGNSNLFLMNPAGIIFGQNASLNVPASFSVTTATGIGFNGNNFWFQAMGTNDYANLVGNPSGYRFNVSNPGVIVNEGNLSLTPGENLTLLGGVVVNTGELSTAGGNITIAAVEGGSTLRISQPGHLLSLEISSSVENEADISNFTPLSLPELLTGGETSHATSMTVNADGDVVLIDTNTIVADVSGDAVASGNIDVSTTPPLSKGGQGGDNIGGQINILGDRVAVIDANINANGFNGGGTILIGGDFQGNGIVSNSRQTFVDGSSFISADAISYGDGGRVIVWSDGITNFGGNISAKGGEFSGDGGFVEVSGKQRLIFDGSVNVSAASGNSGTILLDPENIEVGESEDTEITEDNSDNSEINENSDSDSEITEDNSEVESTENSNNSEINENSDSDSEITEDNSEVESTENSNNSEITENYDSDSETTGDNSEVESNENSDNSEITENYDSNSEITGDNSEIESTENIDNSEITETETPTDPFAQDENYNVTISAENLEDLSGEIILQADNDITVNEKIETDSSVEIKAGRSININADIDTSTGNGNITLFGNDNNANIENRSDGAASINQREGTTLNAGNGRIAIRLGGLGEIGDINLANLTTEGRVILNANSGNITQVSPNSLIRANTILLRTRRQGGIGLSENPLRLDVNNLEAITGKGGALIDAISSLTIGGVNGELTGISTGGRAGKIRLNVDGNLNIEEKIEAANNVRLTASESVNINADIKTADGNGNIFIQGNGEIEIANIIPGDETNLGADSEPTTDEIGNFIPVIENVRSIIQGEETNLEAGSGTIRIELGNLGDVGDIKLANLTTTGRVLVNGNGGNIESISENSLINAGSILFLTSGNGGIGLSEAPLRLNAEKLEAVAGSNGAFFEVLGEINIGGVRENVIGISTTEGGDIQLSAEGKITVTEKISTATSEVDAGNIIIESNSGGIDTTESKINASSELGSGGNITLIGEGDIQTANVDTSASGNGAGGQIKIESRSGSIVTTEGKVISASSYGNGGDIEIRAKGDITTSGLFSVSSDSIVSENLNPAVITGGIGDGGNIILEAGGNIDTTGETVNSVSIKGNSGNIIFTADGNISTGDILSFTYSSNKGGNITFNAGGNIDTTADVIRSDSAGDGGNIEMTANGDITTNFISASSLVTPNFPDDGNENKGGNVTLTAGGNIDARASQIQAGSDKGDGGNITLTAEGNIFTEKILASSNESGNGGNIDIQAGGNIDTSIDRLDSGSRERDAGDITLTSGGNIFTSSINSNSGSSLGNGGEITLDAVGTIDTTGGRLSSGSAGTNSGNISLTANNSVITGNIDTAGVQQGGDINITSASGNIDTSLGLLNSSSEGRGGNITFNAEQRIYTGNINTSGIERGGNIDLTSNSSDINTNAGELNTTAENGEDGNINMNANNGSIEIGEINPAKNITITDGGEEDAFNSDSDSSISSDADQINDQKGEVSLQAHNDITINEPINSDEISNLELKAGRNININADIDTSGGNGNITLSANDNNADINYRQAGTGNITMAEDTILDAGSGNITIQLGTLREIGDITLSNLRTTGTVIVNAEGGNIFAASENSLVRANNIIFQTRNSGGIGLSSQPINLEVDNLEARAGSAGIFLNSPTQGLSIGNTTDLIRGVLTSGGGEIEITAAGNIEATEPISTVTDSETSGNITLNSTGDINTANSKILSWSNNQAGNVTLNAEGNISTASIDANSFGIGRGGDITLDAGGTINTTGGTLRSSSEAGDAGNVNITANNNINTANILSYSGEEAGEDNRGGDITITSRNGSIDTTAGIINEFPTDTDITSLEVATFFERFVANLATKANNGTGGNITLSAKENITVGGISGIGGEISGNISVSSEIGDIDIGDIFSTSRNETSGNITIQSNQGNIELNHIASYSVNGTGGDINLNADGSVTIKNIASFGPQESGDVNIQSNNSTITTRKIQTIAENGTSGNIRLNTYNFQGDINTADIQSIGDRSSGEVEVIAADGSITTQNIESLSNSGNSDDITVEAGEDINTEDINSSGGENSGDIEVSSDNGEVNTGNIESSGNSGDSGNIDVSAEEDINTENISTYGNNNSGDISVNSQEGSVNTNNIETEAETGNSGDIDIAAIYGINTENISSIGGENSGDISVNSQEGSVNTNNIETIAETGDSGYINIVARDDINTGHISSIAGENSGNISVNSQAGSVNTENITTQAETGTAGDIDISARNNINTGNITSTAPQESGNINLTTEVGQINTGEIFTETGKINLNQPNNNLSQPNNNLNQSNNSLSQPTENNPISIAPISTPSTTNNTPTPTIINPTTQISENSPPTPTIINPTTQISENSPPTPTIINPTTQISENSPPTPTNNLTPPSKTPKSNPSPITNHSPSPIINNNQTSTSTNTNPSTINNHPNPITPTSSINNNPRENPANISARQTRNTTNFSRTTTTQNTIQSPQNNSETLINTNPKNTINSNNTNNPNNPLPNSSQTNQQLPQLNLTPTNPLTIETSPSQIILALEKNRIEEYSNYLGENLDQKLLSTKNVREILVDMHHQTGKKSAVIYVNVHQDQLQLILFTPDGQSILKTISEVNRKQLWEIAIKFYLDIIDPKQRNNHNYLPTAKKLYNWLISPISAELKAANIDTLLFSMDAGFRLLPLAALHDGKQFLIEKYNVSLIPSVSLMNSNYNSLKNTKLLAMGASKFSNKPPLPAVPVELKAITKNSQQGNIFLNEEFTRKNLINQRQNYPYPIIHLATHAEFRAGNASKSYIQLWNDKLHLHQIRDLEWNNPEVELLVLSACRTAVGDKNSELGFAGLAIATGVRSVLASLWLVNDEGTLGLMTEFYSHLGNVSIKAEALRAAQIAMLKGKVVIENGMLKVSGSRGEMPLPPELAQMNQKNFSHPYYWAGFTMVGSPW
ncbi:CHAT domain-containing protein [Okeania sp. KiyG1]|uniref:CHAT domain-containing protein n=1 Tax=Okeania sp. KiyG1 TaxID=2720165 RepID=UPI001924B5C6|nr:CHAT domain-containing protein [Okeania sp. KiyG1]GFZ90373.1 hypothetical protein CYANOKiyG1_00670 [Okeania sp. KiyG1]